MEGTLSKYTIWVEKRRKFWMKWYVDEGDFDDEEFSFILDFEIGGDLNDRESEENEGDDKENNFIKNFDKNKSDLYVDGNHLQQLNFKSFGVDSFQIKHQNLKLESTSTNEKDNW